MSNISSPYKEVGVSGHTARQQTPRRTLKPESPEQRGIVLGHDWDVNYKWKSAMEFCKYCRKPRFAVEFEKCKGKKK